MVNEHRMRELIEEGNAEGLKELLAAEPELTRKNIE